MPYLVPLFSAALLVSAVYILWRARRGYPPSTIPRVLAYHKVTSFELGGTWMPPGRFISQIDSLIDAGFRFVDEATFLETLDGRRKVSGREVLVTFDDGYEGLLDSAVPALEERSVPALIFIVTSFVGLENRWELYWPGRRFRHMGWDEIGDLAGRGFDFGSHTCTHRDLTRIQLEAVRDEIVRSKEVLERHLGRQIKCLSYPFGRTNASIAREAERAGYSAAFSLYPKHSSSSIDRFTLRREGVYVIDTVYNLKSKLGGGPRFMFEDLKGRSINYVAALTPLLKGDRALRPRE